MGKQLYFEDVEIGAEIPPLEKKPTTEQLVRYAGASGDFYPIHYDKDFAQASGLPGVILHGALKNAFLGQLVTDWIGEMGTLKRLTCQYRGMDFPGQTLTCKGKITKKYERDGQFFLDCQVWLENPQGEMNTRGTAVVTLPSRKAPGERKA